MLLVKPKLVSYCVFTDQNKSNIPILLKLSKQDGKSLDKDFQQSSGWVFSFDHLLDLRSIVMDFTVGEKIEAVDQARL